MSVQELRNELHIAGVSPTESWEWTWGEALEMIEAYSAREKRKAKQNAILLYNSASFLADSIAKRFSGKGTILPFEKAFPGFQPEKKGMDDDEMLQVVMALNAQFGGEVIR